MNKTELIAAVAEKANLYKKDADSAVNAIIDTIIAQVSQGDRVQLVGFGTFELRERNERKGRDPRTNEEIIIPASKVPAFKVGRGFKVAVK